MGAAKTKTLRNLGLAMRTKKRSLVTTKVYGFNPWMDQLLAINQIMESSGQKSEAPIIRDLIDEALTARRRKTPEVEPAKNGSREQEVSETFQAVQTLLLKLIEQGETGVRAQSVSLELLQETAAEARAGRTGLWEAMAVPTLRQAGNNDTQIAGTFDRHTNDGRHFAYSLAEQIRNELLAEETPDNQNGVDDRQGRLSYDPPNVAPEENAQVN
jgi:hypothetical protein